MNLFWKMGVLIRRDFLQELSYRLNFFLELMTIVFYASTFYFVSKLIPPEAANYLGRYEGDYFSFVLIGLAFSSFLNVSLNMLANAFRLEQMAGTLEALIATPTPIWVIILARVMWNLLYGGTQIAFYFIFGTVFLSASYSGANLAAIPVIILLSLAGFNALGLLSAAFILTFKRGNPISMALGFGSAFLGGVYFPVEVLPGVLQKIAAFIPITYVLRLMRDACIRGASFSDLAPDLILLTLLCVVLLPLSWIAFSFALRKARREGSLSHY